MTAHDLTKPTRDPGGFFVGSGSPGVPGERVGGLYPLSLLRERVRVRVERLDFHWISHRN
jgi:hypothetical protein